MRNPLLMTLSLLLAMYCSQAGSQEPEDGAFQARRAEFRANMINGCSASLIEPAIRTAVRKAEAAGMVGLTEEAIRKTFSADKMRGMIAGVCSCIMAQPLARVDQARTAGELGAILDEFRTPETLLAMIDEDGMKRCAAPLQVPALITPRQRPATQDWQQVGTWAGTDAYVDTLSIKRLDDDRVQAWVRAVFAQPRPTSGGDIYASVELLQNFDCEEETVQTISTAAFSDGAGQKVVYRFETGEAQARFEPVGTGSQQQMYDWLCARIKHP